MALQLTDATAIINTTTNLIAANSDYCCMFWWRPSFVATNPDYICPWVTTNAGYTAWAGWFGNILATYHIDLDSGGPSAVTPNSAVAANQNANFAYRRFGNTHQFLHNGFIVGTGTLDITAVTLAEMLLGNDRFSLVTTPILIWDFKEWSNSKSVGTVRAEMAVYGAVDSVTGLSRFTPLLNDLLDDSGNGRDWTGAGNFTFVANPSLPTNLTAATATLIPSLPFSETLESYNLPLWYRRIPVTGESYLGGWGFGDLVGYDPAAFAWTADGTVEWPNASFQTIAVNVPFEFPVVPGDNYYSEFRSDFGGAAYGELDVSFLPQPTAAIPIGTSFLITDESEGYGASIISSVDGEVFQFKYPNFPASEAGAALFQGDGRIMIAATGESAGPELYLYDAALTLIDTVPRGTDVAQAATSNKVDTFYVSFNPPGVVENYVLAYDSNAVVDPTVIGPITGTSSSGIGSMAISPDGTILYYQRPGNNLGAIRAWDLVNNVALPDLVAAQGAGWFALGGLLVLPDGSVIGGQDQFLSGTGGFLRSYDSAGVQQWSFDTGTLTIDYHGAKLAYGADYPDDIWLIVHFANGHSRFIHLDAATGADLGDGFDVATYTAGVYNPVESATPESRFGPSPSCFIYMLQAFAPPQCPGLTGNPRTDGLPYSPYEPGT